ncbi:MAG: Global regulator protein family [Gammaproteobacteria bacterium]|jgi:carbon storage regulator CsrA|nr:Global regulator protein family [Gammaproteobacteria bacterium]
MLTLTRSPGEGLLFGDEGEIQMVILDVSRGQVKLGFKAPPSTRIERKELRQFSKKTRSTNTAKA